MPTNQRVGGYVTSADSGEIVRAFVPPPLPPAPPLQLDGLQVLLEQANQAVGRLDGLASVLPDLSLFIYAYVRKEAVAQTHPILSIATPAEDVGITFPTVAGAIDHMQQRGILREITGRQRGRLFAYGAYLDILNEGTEPIR